MPTSGYVQKTITIIDQPEQTSDKLSYFQIAQELIIIIDPARIAPQLN